MYLNADLGVVKGGKEYIRWGSYVVLYLFCSSRRRHEHQLV